MTRLIAVATTVGFLCAGAWTIALAAASSADPLPAVHVRADGVQVVDGRGVAWWARRARSNGRTARTEAQSLRTIRRALQAHVSLSGGHGAAAGLTAALLCIGSHEGPWGYDGRNPTHFGRWQMDRQFESLYGAEFLRAWGNAYNWPRWAQIAVAARAVLSGRGFHPWDQTRGLCGL